MCTFECPYCGKENEVEAELLPDRACDDMDFECQHCENEMKIGWIPEIEVRLLTVEAGDLIDA